ncbi:hypothetical protein V2W45_1525787 [Cenococcum geophilum]
MPHRHIPAPTPPTTAASSSAHLILYTPNNIATGLTLRLCGYLTLIDATHKTNWLRWLLYTIIVPGGHFLTKKENGDIIAKALKPFIDADIIIDYLLYIVYLERTLKRNFTGKKYAKVLHYIITALNIGEVIKILERIKDYKKLNYLIKEYYTPTKLSMQQFSLKGVEYDLRALENNKELMLLKDENIYTCSFYYYY